MTRAEQVRQQIKELQNSLNENYMALADLLYEAWIERYYLEYGYSSLYEYIEAELDIKPRKAAYLISIKKKLLKLGLDWQDVEGIGWRKLGCISSHLNQDNYKELIEKAKNLSLRELSAELSQSGADTEQENKEETHKIRMTIMLDKDSMDIVQTALDEAKHIWNTQSNSEALKNICYEWFMSLEVS